MEQNGNAVERDQEVIDIKITGTDTDTTAGNTDQNTGSTRKKRRRNTSSAAAAGTAGKDTGNQNSKVFEIPVVESAKPKKTKADQELTANIQMLLEVTFNVLAIKAGEHWSLTNEESLLIADPMSRILKRLGVNKTASKYMDYITLTTAAGIVIIPRVIISKELHKNTSRGNIDNAEKRTVATNDQGTIKPNEPQSTNNESIRAANIQMVDEY